MTSATARPSTGAGDGAGAAEPGAEERTKQGLTLFGRLGLAGRTGFYAILTALTIRIALLGGASGHQADAHGALALISRPTIGKVAIGAVALGFLLFGAGRLLGAVKDEEASAVNRALTVVQGLFYLALTYVPCSYLAGNYATGSQQQQTKSTSEVLGLPGGQIIVIVAGVIFVGVCVQQIHGALAENFRKGLDTDDAPAWLRRLARVSGVVGIAARALVFLPVGIFLIVSAAEFSPGKSYGTDAELLKLSGHTWGVAVLAAVALGLAVFTLYSAIETRYRKVVSAA